MRIEYKTQLHNCNLKLTASFVQTRSGLTHIGMIEGPPKEWKGCRKRDFSHMIMSWWKHLVTMILSKGLSKDSEVLQSQRVHIPTGEENTKYKSSQLHLN